MTILNIKIDGKNNIIKMPSSWHELITDELVFAIRLFTAPRPLYFEEIEDAPNRKLNFFMAFLRKNKLDKQLIEDWKNIRDKEDDDDEKLSFMLEKQKVLNECTAFLFTTIRRFNKPVEVLTPDLLRCPFPKLAIPTKRGIRNLYAPSCGKNARSLEPIEADVLQNITIYELGQAFTHYENWATNNDEESLNALIATIYREKKPDTKQNRATNYGGDIRLPLRGYEATIPQRKDLIAQNIPSHVKDCIAYWFGSCRHHFAALYPDIFSDSGSDNTQSFGYAGIILELSRATHEGKNTIADQNAHSTMVELQYEIHRAKSSNTEGV
jgi:hypothetical protein